VSRGFSVYVEGRPAPQGSKKLGAQGQMLEQAGAALPAWRNAVKRACFQWYHDHEITPGRLPLLRGPVSVGISFYITARVGINYPPDLDKLTRATLDALKMGRLYEDDARVRRAYLMKDPADAEHPMGAFITAHEWAEPVPIARGPGVTRLVVARLGRRTYGEVGT